MKILLIEDHEAIVEDVLEEGRKLSLNIVPFEPESKERDNLISQLADLCKSQKFDFAILDYELWSGNKGYIFAETLNEFGIKFVAFSSSDEYNENLFKVGAFDCIPKIYNARGFNTQRLRSDLIRLFM